jgi:hypothetical protein
MTYDQLLTTIRSTSPADWVYNDEQGVHTLRADLNVRIQRRRDDDAAEESFNEPWATGHPDPSASKMFYDIYYGSSLVDSFMLVSVDGHRADLPLPDPQTKKTIARKDYELARAVDFMGTLDQYIQRSGLTVETQQVEVTA